MKKQNILNIEIITVIATGFLFLNLCQPIFADDFGRLSASAVTNGNLLSIIYSQYMTWTGRVSAEFLAYIIFNKDHVLISLFAVDVLNSVIFCIFTVFSFKIVTKDRYQLSSKQFITFLFFFCLLFLYSGVIGNALWKTAAIQYFWGIALLVGYYYFVFIKHKNSVLFSIFTGLFIGLYNEIYVGFLVVFSMAYFLERYLSKKPINKDIVYFFIALIIGGAILFAAPGNYKRLDVLAGSRSISFSQNIHFMYQLLIYHPYAKLLHYLVVGIAILLTLSRNIKKRSAIIYFVAIVSSLFVLTPVVGQYGGLNQRVLMIYFVIFFLIFFSLLHSCENIFITKLVEMFNRLFWLLGAMLILQLWIVFSVYISLHNYETERQQYINYYHVNNIENAVFPINYQRYVDTGYNFIYFDDITFNSNDWRNKGFASYYGFKSVVLVNPNQLSPK